MASALSAVVVGGSCVMIAVTLFGLHRALMRTDWPGSERATVLQAAAIVLIGWFALAAVPGWVGAYERASDQLPTIQFAILVPLAIGALLIWRSSTVSRIIEAVPQQWLVGVQVLRLLGAIFLVLYAAGRMPGLFALPAGIGDVLVGALAPAVAYAHARNPRGSANSIIAWNVLGIADLVVALGTGFATSPSLLQLAAFENPNALIVAFPLVLIPAYLVPLWILLHVVSLTKLRRESSRMSSRGSAAAASA